jgi:hypothetical protein
VEGLYKLRNCYLPTVEVLDACYDRSVHPFVVVDDPLDDRWLNLSKLGLRTSPNAHMHIRSLYTYSRDSEVNHSVDRITNWYRQIEQVTALGNEKTLDLVKYASFTLVTKLRLTSSAAGSALPNSI